MTPQRRAAERLGTALVLGTAAAFLLSWLLPAAWNYLSPFIIALPFASMLQPSVRWLERKLHLKHTLAALIPVLLFLLVVLTVVIWFLSYGIGQLTGLLSRSSEIVTPFIATLRQTILSTLDRVDLLDSDALSWVRGALENLLSWMATVSGQLATYLLNESVNFAAGVPYALVYANFLCMGIYFIAKDYEGFARYFPNRKRSGSESSLNRLSTSGLQGALGYLRVQVTYSLISLVVGYLFWQIMGNPYAALIALLAALLELIPLLGNGAVYIPWAVVALLVDGYRAALPPIGLYLGLLAIRRLTEPKVMSHNMGVSPFLSLVSMFIGLRVGGIPGLVAGPVLMTLLVAVAREHYLSTLVGDAKTLFRWLMQRWTLPEDAAPPAAEPPAPGPEAASADALPAADQAAAETETGEKPKTDGGASPAGTMLRRFREKHRGKKNP